MLSKRQSRKTGKRNFDRVGAVTVEFALASGLFFMIFMASIEFTRFMFARHTLDQAAYEAARFGIVPGNSADETRARAVSFLNMAGVYSANVTVTPAVFSDQTRQVTVRIESQFAENSWVAPIYTGNVTLTSQVTLDHENLAVLLQPQ